MPNRWPSSTTASLPLSSRVAVRPAAAPIPAPARAPPVTAPIAAPAPAPPPTKTMSRLTFDPPRRIPSSSMRLRSSASAGVRYPRIGIALPFGMIRESKVTAIMPERRAHLAGLTLLTRPMTVASAGIKVRPLPLTTGVATRARKRSLIRAEPEESFSSISRIRIVPAGTSVVPAGRIAVPSSSRAGGRSKRCAVT